MLTKLYNNFKVKKARGRALPKLDQFLKDVTGIVHIGAHRGSERHFYESLDLKVVWVEADPQTYARLTKNIKGYPNQQAINILVSNVAQDDTPFNRASNGGASSSMLAFQDHAKAFPDVTMVDELRLRALPFQQIAAENNLELKQYQGLVIDVQGAELMVLEGFGDALQNFNYIKLEASDFPAYEGGATMEQLTSYLNSHGFQEQDRETFYNNAELGNYFDVVFAKQG